jgi:chitodextrinase
VDAALPTMNGALTSSAVTSGGFTLNWPAASDNVGVTGYEYSTDNGTTYINAGNVLTKAVAGLTASTAYNTKVRAYDAAGNKATPLSLAVTTAASADTTVPTLAGSITVSAITSGGARIAWPAGSDNVAVTGYEYSTDGGSSYLNAGNVLFKDLTGLASSTAYPIRVRAYDAAGLRSTPALAATVTTAAGSAGGTLTTQDFQNGSGAVQANLTGLTVQVLSVPSLDVVKKFTSETTDASGFNVVTDALLVPGTKYAHITLNSAGTVIGADIITAT